MNEAIYWIFNVDEPVGGFDSVDHTFGSALLWPSPHLEIVYNFREVICVKDTERNQGSMLKAVAKVFKAMRVYTYELIGDITEAQFKELVFRTQCAREEDTAAPSLDFNVGE
jgi:hypothetical protein